MGGTDENKPDTFQKRLERLSEIVEELERGELSLETAIDRFEVGRGLHQQLLTELDAYEARLEKLVAKPEDGAGPEGDPGDR